MTTTTTTPRRLLHYGCNAAAAAAAAFFRARGLEVEHAARGTGVLLLAMGQAGALEALEAERAARRA